MKLRFVLVLLLPAVFALSQAKPSAKEGLHFLGYDIGEQFVLLNYELPYGGVVELRIYKEESTLVWQNQYVNDRGENTIRLKSTAFESGVPYTLQLNYKQDIFKKDFTVTR